MNNPIDQAPIFIVGVPRSGTTLLAAMLAAHSQLSCGPETRFFHFLAQTDPQQLLEDWPEKAVDYLFSLILIEPVPHHYGLTREAIATALKAQPPSIPSIISALTEQYMQQQGKRRWVEKSPEHLICVDAIRAVFPNSPIIRIVRDPRDVALSLVKTPWAPQDFLEALLFWRMYDLQSTPFFQADANCYTLYYENLVQTPERELRQLCAFLGESFEPQMLDTSTSATKVTTEKEAWKHLVAKPVDQSRIHTWKRELSKEQNQAAEALIGDRLLAYGYECAERFEQVADVYPSVETLLKYRQSMASFVDAKIKFWHDVHERQSDLMIYLGSPEQDRWLRDQKPGRWWDTLRIISRILKGKLAHQPVFWVRDRVAVVQAGFCGRLIAWTFQLTGERQFSRNSP
ncbi:MAG: sulfotransferase [Caldilineaceae bacterium]